MHDKWTTRLKYFNICRPRPTQGGARKGRRWKKRTCSSQQACLPQRQQQQQHWARGTATEIATATAAATTTTRTTTTRTTTRTTTTTPNNNKQQETTTNNNKPWPFAGGLSWVSLPPVTYLDSLTPGFLFHRWGVLPGVSSKYVGLLGLPFLPWVAANNNNK